MALTWQKSSCVHVAVHTVCSEPLGGKEPVCLGHSFIKKLSFSFYFEAESHQFLIVSCMCIYCFSRLGMRCQHRMLTSYSTSFGQRTLFSAEKPSLIDATKACFRANLSRAYCAEWSRFMHRSSLISLTGRKVRQACHDWWFLVWIWLKYCCVPLLSLLVHMECA